MQLKAKLLTALTVLSCGLSVDAMADCPGLLTLPTASAQNSVTFGDGISYSLPILGLNVQSSPGQINDCIVVTTGSSGVPIETNFAGMDNAYPNSNTAFFRTGDPVNSPDPGQVAAFSGDTATTWDTRISALSTFLNGNSMVLYFNHNQTNSGGAIDQDIYVWAQIKLVDDAGVLPSLYFYVAATPNALGFNNFGQPGGNPLAFTGPQADTTCTYPTGPAGGAVCPNGLQGSPAVLGDVSFMVQGRGQVCLNGPVGVGTPVPCPPPPGGVTVNENLGANQVANAIVFPEINAILNTPGFLGYDVIQADIRFGCNAATIAGGVCAPGSVMNNGFEQLFIGQLATTPGPPSLTPEPGILALFGLGLFAAGLAGIRRRKI
jgi:hypothetical protein